MIVSEGEDNMREYSWTINKNYAIINMLSRIILEYLEIKYRLEWMK